MLVATFHDDMIEIRNGRATKIKKDDAVKRFQAYFDASTFIEWDDVTPPIVEISDDAKMAYSIVTKRVRLKNAQNIDTTDVFAWISTFRKVKGRWLMTSIASTTQAK